MKTFVFAINLLGKRRLPLVSHSLSVIWKIKASKKYRKVVGLGWITPELSHTWRSVFNLRPPLEYHSEEIKTKQVEMVVKRTINEGCHLPNIRER